MSAGPQVKWTRIGYRYTAAINGHTLEIEPIRSFGHTTGSWTVRVDGAYHTQTHGRDHAKNTALRAVGIVVKSASVDTSPVDENVAKRILREIIEAEKDPTVKAEIEAAYARRFPLK